jgi:hypothetical protein
MTRRKRTPYRIDCHYFITAWASEANDEHRMLTRVMLALFRHPTLPSDRLVRSLQNQPFEIRAQLANPEHMEDPSDLWNALDNEMRPSLSYLITLALDPWSEVTGPAVRTLTIRTGQAQGLPERPALQPNGVAGEANYIGGTIRDKDGAPQSAIEVALKGTGFLTTTDTNGRFTLTAVPSGDYTLIAWPREGRPKQRKIAIPTVDGDYDLTL